MKRFRKIAEAHKIALNTEIAKILDVDGLESIYERIANNSKSKVFSFGDEEIVEAFCAVTLDYKTLMQEIFNEVGLITKLRFAAAIPTLLDWIYKMNWSQHFPSNAYVLTLGKTRKNFDAQIILNEVEDFARAGQANFIWVDTRKSNNSARKFYERSGFTEFSQSPCSVLYKKCL